jgi:hypothetical protein
MAENRMPEIADDESAIVVITSGKTARAVFVNRPGKPDQVVDAMAPDEVRLALSLGLAMANHVHE